MNSDTRRGRPALGESMGGRLPLGPIVLGLACLLLSCDAPNDRVIHPTFPDGGMLKSADELPAASGARLRGLYQVTAAGARFGDTVAVQGTRDWVSILAAANTAYAAMKAGCIDNGHKLVLEGYWRYAHRTDTGLIRLFVDPPEAASALCAGASLPADAAPLRLSGAVGIDRDLPGEPAAFSFQEPLRVDPDHHTFVLAHRGGCRTSDDCGASENSAEVIRIAESLGALGVEVDVRVTADGVPILYHDDEFTPRLTRGEYCHGSVEEFTFAHVRALCTLKYGERVPTLDEALAAALRDTTLRGVWLDIKSASAIVPAVHVASRYNAEAATLGRAFVVVAGLGDSDLVDAWVQQGAGAFGVPCLAEESEHDVRRAGCLVWAPRWTLGPMAAQVAAMQGEGRSVAFWTLDEVEFINMFLRDSTPNAFLTNRPGLVFQRFQLLGAAHPAGVEP